MNSRVIFLFVILLSISTFFNSCGIIPIGNNGDKVFVHDTIYINNSEDGLRAVAGNKKLKHVQISDIGDEYVIRKGETIALSFSEFFDLNSSTIEYVNIDGSDDILMRVVNKRDLKIELKYKCQVITRIGTDYVPMIEVADGLKPEQIVVTPLFDSTCQKVGYEIRYGSTERGCKKVAISNLKRFNDCTKVNPPPPIDPCNDASLCRKLGLNPCCTK